MLFCMMDLNAAAKSCGCSKSTDALGHLGGFVEEEPIAAWGVQGNVFWLGKSPRRAGAWEVVWEISQRACLLCSFIAICCWLLSKPAWEPTGPLVIRCMAFPVFLLLKIYFFH